jgi:hypothetical protein
MDDRVYVSDRVREGILIFTTGSTLTLGTTHPPIQWVLGVLSTESKAADPSSD